MLEIALLSGFSLRCAILNAVATNHTLNFNLSTKALGLIEPIDFLMVGGKLLAQLVPRER